MARASWSFNFTAKDAAAARSEVAAWVKDKLPTLGLTTEDAAEVTSAVSHAVDQAIDTATVLRLEGGFFVELTGRVRPDGASRNGAGLGVFVSAPIPDA
jgi:hypothetical protein